MLTILGIATVNNAQSFYLSKVEIKKSFGNQNQYYSSYIIFIAAIQVLSLYVDGL